MKQAIYRHLFDLEGKNIAVNFRDNRAVLKGKLIL